MTVQRTKAKTGFYIAASCPACGDKLSLEEDFFVVRCKSCATTHRLQMPDVPPAFVVKPKIASSGVRFIIDRHLKQQKLPLTNSSFQLRSLYFPYWRIQGVLFRLRQREIAQVISGGDEYSDMAERYEDYMAKEKKTEASLAPYETTVPAAESKVVPDSLGARADYISLEVYSEENLDTGFGVTPVSKSWEEVRQALNINLKLISGFAAADDNKAKTELFLPRISLIYFPYFVGEVPMEERGQFYVVDGVSGRVTERRSPSDELITESVSTKVSAQFGAISVVPHRCGNCGHELPEEQSYVYLCRHCQFLTHLDLGYQLNAIHVAGRSEPLERGFDNLRYDVESPTGISTYETSSSPMMVPFWGLRAPNAKELSSILSGGIHQSDWVAVPAFKYANFEAVFRLSKRMSTVMPKLTLQKLEGTDKHYLPVTVRYDEAVMLARVFAYRQQQAQGKKGAELSAWEPQEVRLFYMPFSPQSYFFVDDVMGIVSFEKKLVG